MVLVSSAMAMLALARRSPMTPNRSPDEQGSPKAFDRKALREALVQRNSGLRSAICADSPWPSTRCSPSARTRAIRRPRIPRRRDQAGPNTSRTRRSRIRPIALPSSSAAMTTLAFLAISRPSMPSSLPMYVSSSSTPSGNCPGPRCAAVQERYLWLITNHIAWNQIRSAS